MASPSASSYGSGTPPPQSTPLSPKYLFGGDRRWDSSQWTDSDDRVRGGRSQSHLTVSRVGAATRAEFSGHLDTSALGGAGFASQRTVDDLCCWDLSGYESLTLDVAEADEKRYTLILKDTILSRRDDGREQSTVSWEYDFTVGTVGGNAGSTTVVMPLADFQPTYRGRPKPDATPLDLSKVKRITFMMRR
ncbi:putative cia30 family protein [Phaeoacremonium minimum UCRPA7]|uniref:Putative cia30 family protein n=1 Tax=Phaeoacremonium minimum (strain UCR-PA7) TaxID=1286976 RepID=R8BIY2_PHAM7|nr:putative cia30 family protein [Phaeoacremonium minimum UCRPA7]EON99280.1 putative cia30 family protein [Phaeoacremonium minimum UCRPA7]